MPPGAICKLKRLGKGSFMFFSSFLLQLTITLESKTSVSLSAQMSPASHVGSRASKTPEHGGPSPGSRVGPGGPGTAGIASSPGHLQGLPLNCVAQVCTR